MDVHAELVSQGRVSLHRPHQQRSIDHLLRLPAGLPPPSAIQRRPRRRELSLQLRRCRSGRREVLIRTQVPLLKLQARRKPGFFLWMSLLFALSGCYRAWIGSGSSSGYDGSLGLKTNTKAKSNKNPTVNIMNSFFMPTSPLRTARF
jgi:hypothetical protein